MACCVTASPAWFVPLTVIDPSPVIDVVGYVPMSPETVVGPVLVMPAPARTAKLSVVASGTAIAEAPAVPASASATMDTTANTP